MQHEKRFRLAKTRELIEHASEGIGPLFLILDNRNIVYRTHIGNLSA
jgi:hypothetical protein